ncbi:hypothetical protein BH23ACI1_BH23ACI1_21430 [soil metagenome]|nr:hypothetical protein [Acidobacteriota bacterium]
MKVPIALLVGLLAVLPAASVPSQGPKHSSVVEKAFRAGGSVRLDLSAGEYVIRGTPDDTIRLRWHTRTSEDAARVQADVVVDGQSASVRTGGPKDGFSVEIDLPSRTNINLSLSAGDLKVRGLQGNKDISVWAGDVLLEVGSPDQYRKVDASVRLGDLTMQPFGLDNTGGVFRSRSWSGSGEYTIKAALFAGDLKLVR